MSRGKEGRRSGDSHRIGGARADVGHNGDDNMLLNGERTGVERDTEDLDRGNNAGPETEDGERNQLGNDL